MSTEATQLSLTSPNPQALKVREHRKERKSLSWPPTVFQLVDAASSRNHRSANQWVLEKIVRALTEEGLLTEALAAELVLADPRQPKHPRRRRAA